MELIGGQAVIEGVMMKGPRGWAVAVRRPDGGIQLRAEPLRRPPWRLPLLRGVHALGQTLALGIKALQYSAQVAYPEEGPGGGLKMSLSVALAVALALGLFLALPLYLTKLLGLLIPWLAHSALGFSLADGLLRVGAFLAYVWAIGLWAEMRRVFQYHGAEHKAIHALEAKVELSPQALRAMSTRHPRCGTSFLLIVMVLAIMVFSLIPQGWPLWGKLLARLLLLPLLAGGSYELLRLGARLRGKGGLLWGMLVAPGLALQGLTTREPDEGQMQVALAALKAVLRMQK
jgi:uncharacterized protein YqhQ